MNNPTTCANMFSSSLRNYPKPPPLPPSPPPFPPSTILCHFPSPQNPSDYSHRAPSVYVAGSFSVADYQLSSGAPDANTKRKRFSRQASCYVGRQSSFQLKKDGKTVTLHCVITSVDAATGTPTSLLDTEGLRFEVFVPKQEHCRVRLSIIANLTSCRSKR